MGTVWQPEFRPAWRVRFFLIAPGGAILGPYRSIWHRTRIEAEEHAMFVLDMSESLGVRLYDIQRKR